MTVEIALAADQFDLTDIPVGSSYTSFEEAPAHVTGLVIPGDFVYKQEDKTWLDNIRVTTVPEPGTLLLLLCGLAAVALVRPRTRGSARDRPPRGG